MKHLRWETLTQRCAPDNITQTLFSLGFSRAEKSCPSWASLAKQHHYTGHGERVCFPKWLGNSGWSVLPPAGTPRLGRRLFFLMPKSHHGPWPFPNSWISHFSTKNTSTFSLTDICFPTKNNRIQRPSGTWRSLSCHVGQWCFRSLIGWGAFVALFVGQCWLVLVGWCWFQVCFF